ncbi:DUF4190 domain-containing protein [Pseudalkalibacillus sp. Hm43]|uniref:DUF4190 domain-containing protein n=1 Tax=Pseudalkalibacillus sp. Hm43 TaxID=3450742 RepID=UPI003F4408E8
MSENNAIVNDRAGQTNSNAIIGLVMGILSLIIPVIGFILGVIGIVMSRKAQKEIQTTNERGKGLATAGLVCSIVGVGIHLLFALLIIVSFATFSSFETMM